MAVGVPSRVLALDVNFSRGGMNVRIVDVRGEFDGGMGASIVVFQWAS